MLKKMQRRFIMAAMAAFATVMLVLVVGINIVNYYRTTSTQDGLAASLLEYEQRAYEHRARRNASQDENPKEHERRTSAHQEPEFPPISEMPGGGPEARFTTRFFAVYCDLSENIEVISRDYIYSIDEETAKAYTAAVLRKGKEKGYYGDYRYHVKVDDAGSTVLFLNVTSALQFMRSLLIISLVIGFSSLLVVLILVVFFSRYAVRPYAKNMERQKRFITDAGHELKTPITSIATSADIAAMEYEGDEWISNIQKQTARLTRLVGELVALSRLDEEIPFPEKSTFSLSDVAWETAELFAVRAKAEGKNYCQNIEEQLTIYGDCNSIQQMISILLDNAVKYSDVGGEIHLDIYRKRRKVCIKVSNTCDLPDGTDLDRLFDRFYRVDESRATNTGGTGIGLAMAQAIVETHGGKIKAERTDEKTICFKVIL
ncbi:MAG: HAMP domain-containing histidine kinase [Lachnospiraceae bacterium]|jgi:hypothetical protein|nr:HAMP domain-containing histidine kinase [Lachnospiraceae bacterium]